MPPGALGFGELGFGCAAGLLSCIGTATEVAPDSGLLYTSCQAVNWELRAMQRHPVQSDDERIAANLRQTIELTELGLALRRSVLQQEQSPGDAMAQVMRDIRRAKEQAWQRNPS